MPIQPVQPARPSLAQRPASGGAWLLAGDALFVLGQRGRIPFETHTAIEFGVRRGKRKEKL